MAGGWRRLTGSVTARLVVLAFLSQLLVTAGVLLFVRQASQQALVAGQKELIGELRSELLAGYRSGGRAELVRLIDARLGAVRSDAAVILLIDRDGRPVVGNIGAWPTVLPAETRWRTIDLFRQNADRPEHMGIATTRLADGSRLLTGHVIDGDLRLARINEEAMLAALAMGLALTLISALVLGRVLARQVAGIAATAAAVGEGALGQRVPVGTSGDAFDVLGRSINAMLDRIEALVTQLRMMTDGLAHDLKSPVTRLKTVIERAMLGVRDADALAALEKVSDEAETLLAMLTTALLISRTEAGIGRDHFVETELATLLGDVAEIYGPLAEDHGFSIALDVPADLRMPLNRDLVSRAVGNLVENTLKYGAGGQHIAIGAVAERQAVTITVCDDGPGIPAAQRAEALRRFGRLDPARHQGGAGLGLSLVAAVAHLHHGAVTLGDNAPGLCVALRLGRHSDTA